MNDPTKPLQSGPWVTVLWALGLVLALFVLEQDVERMLWDAHIQPGAGKIGIHAQPVRFFGEGVVEVTAVDLDSPAVRAGLREGDHLRFDRVYDFDRRMMQLGEAVGLTRLDGIAPQHMVLVAAAPGPLSAEVVFSRELFSLSTIIPALFGAFILWRSRGRPSAQWLGLALVTFGWTSPDVAMLEARPGIYAFLTAFNYAGYGAVPVAFVVFAMRAYEENVGRWRKRTWAALAGYATLAFAAAGLQAWGEITACTLPVLGDGENLATAVIWVGLLAALVGLVVGLRRSSRESRERYALLVVAMSALIAAQAIQSAGGLLIQDNDWYQNAFTYLADILSGLIAPFLFAYAILKQRVLDLGFAVNRTLVYGTTSFLLLAVFGISEWASEKFIPIREGDREGLVGACVALGIFLAFHRIRDIIERIVEDLFFRRWRDNEKALRTFVAEAAFYGKSSALAAAMIAELRRFSGGAEVALYLAGKKGAYVLDDGGVAGIAASVDGDDKTFVALRAGNTAQNMPDGGLALPLMPRRDLVGIVFVGGKPSGEAWRPDERQVLGWAAHQFSLDLHALRMEHLDRQAAKSRQRASALAAQLKLAMKAARLT